MAIYYFSVDIVVLAEQHRLILFINENSTWEMIERTKWIYIKGIVIYKSYK